MFLEESVCVSLIYMLIVQIGKIYKLFLDITVKLSFDNKAVTNLINPIIILNYEIYFTYWRNLSVILLE